MVHKSTLGPLLACCFCLLLRFEVSESAEFKVGGGNGWDYNVGNWSNGMAFGAGDVLVFEYDPQVHNVAVVDADGYRSCRPNPSSIVFASGHDRFPLTRGVNYFLCSVPGHCELGMKMAVKAT